MYCHDNDSYVCLWLKFNSRHCYRTTSFLIFQLFSRFFLVETVSFALTFSFVAFVWLIDCVIFCLIFITEYVFFKCTFRMKFNSHILLRNSYDRDFFSMKLYVFHDVDLVTFCTLDRKFKGIDRLKWFHLLRWHENDTIREIPSKYSEQSKELKILRFARFHIKNVLWIPHLIVHTVTVSQFTTTAIFCVCTRIRC